jgi:superoxide dismutase, Fe-Mn family
MKFELPELPYAHNSLAPYLSQETIDYHYGKHLQTYINNINGLIPGTPFETDSLENMIRKAEGGIFNNASQVWNHIFYFESFSPNDRRGVAGKVAVAIESDFGSYEAFKEEFTKAASTLFGAGWVWLSLKQDSKLVITQESNAGNPLRSGLIPLLTCDVWEHAYYIDYRNRRPDYIKNFWEILDWDIVDQRFNMAITK